MRLGVKARARAGARARARARARVGVGVRVRVRVSALPARLGVACRPNKAAAGARGIAAR